MGEMGLRWGDSDADWDLEPLVRDCGVSLVPMEESPAHLGRWSQGGQKWVVFGENTFFRAEI